MSGTTARTELNNNQTQTRDFDVGGPSVQRGQTCINWAQLDTKIVYVATVFPFSLSRSLS